MQAATGNVTEWDTGVEVDVLKWVGLRSVHIPEGFSLHPTLRRGHVDARINKLVAATHLDWSTAETLALGSLLYQGKYYIISIVLHCPFLSFTFK